VTPRTTMRFAGPVPRPDHQSRLVASLNRSLGLGTELRTRRAKGTSAPDQTRYRTTQTAAD
jgi:hypothetical protein